MTKNGQRLLAGVFDIILGITLASISICFYYSSIFEYSEAIKTIFFIIDVIIFPLLGLVLIGFGIKNLLVKDKNEE